jgi:two-component system, cell cycle response regulator
MRIVFVDPSRAMQRIMTPLLAHDAHEVLAFGDGRKAFDRIASDDQVRALITSTQPENISGVELCGAARKLAGSRRALYIMLMSATEDHDLVVQALDNGADDFVRKPPVEEELRARLRTADRVTSMQHALIGHATTDHLSGLLSRRSFFERAVEACHQAKEGKALSAIFFDLDRFKAVNDTYGHEAGDAVLAAVGAQTQLVKGIAGRLGGEEFCLLVACDLTDAVGIAEDLQQAIRNLTLENKNEVFRVTCSFGVAQWNKDLTIDGLLRRADLALYESKNSGRDRITVYGTFSITKRHDAWLGVIRTAGRRS